MYILNNIKSELTLRKENYGSKFNSLDGIRGMAFLLVLLSHFSGYYGLPYIGVGKVGVWLFFVLSAFLLTHYFITMPEKAKNPIEWANYLLRRFLRIYPVYVLILPLYLWSQYVIMNPSMIVQHLLLQAGEGHLWTIAAEFKYYLLLPIVIYILIVILRKNTILAILFLAVVTAIHQYYFPASKSTVSSYYLITYLPVFITGSVAALLHEQLSKKITSKNVKNGLDILSIIILIGIVVTMPPIWSKIISPVPYDIFFKSFVYFGFAFGVLILAVLNGNNLIRRIFENRALIFLGVISYEGYLIHPFVLCNVEKLFKNTAVPAFITAIFAATVIIIFATLLHVLIEKPLMSIRLVQR